MDSLEHVDDFFKGVLSDVEKAAFEKRILSDPAFAAEVAFYISAGDLVKGEAGEEKKARFRVLYEQSKAAGPARAMAPARGTVRRLWPYAAAASVLVAVACIWWVSTRRPDPEKLADRYIANNLKDLSVNMGEQDSLQKGIGAYNAGDLAGALRQFAGILERRDTAHEELARRYAGIVCLRLKDYDKALHYFQQLEADTTLYINPGLFYESLTLLKRNLPGDAGRARQLLQQVVDRNLDKKEEAQEWLKEME
jgi:tetratricopeptide (TPR) repeat protein